MPVCAVWGQGAYDEILSAPENTETTKSITRAWRDNAQITLIQTIEYNPYNADEIVSITAKFVYYDPTCNEYKVAEFDNSYWPIVTDLDILEDTLYFCGYANVTASSAAPFYMGYIGYFCIPEMFSGGGDIHALVFNQQYGTLDEPPFWYVSDPRRIKALKLENGIHLICTGEWSNSWKSTTGAGQFVADVVYEFATNDWWYNIRRDYGMAHDANVVVTDYSADSLIYLVNNCSELNFWRIPSRFNGILNTAFHPVTLPVTIYKCTKETLYQP